MSEKENAKPARRKKTPDATEKPIAKKSAKKAKPVEEPASAKSVKRTPAAKKKVEDFVLDAETGELKPAKKRAPRKKLAVTESPETPAVELLASPELSAIAGSEIAENIRVIEETIEDLPLPKVKAPRKKAAAPKKAKPETASSDTVSKKKIPAKKTIAKVSKKKDSDTKINEEILSPVEEKTAQIVEAPVTVVEALVTVEENNVVADAPAQPERSAVFLELAEPKLPVLTQENRARLQIQSPHRVFFYWSIKNNPYETLYKAFPANRANDFRLVVKFISLNDGSEQIHPVEAAGEWWFDAKPNTSYRAEVGFYSAHRPFVRLLYSNTVETPRAEPSPNRDWSMDFAVSATQFAEVLDVAGYAHDAFEVAITGDNPQETNAATQKTFTVLGGQNADESDLSELRFALFALASGSRLETLRDQIGKAIYDRLDTIIRHDAGQLSAETVRRALNDNFEFENEPEEFLTPVFGASSINFPRRKPRLPKLSPVSSLR